MLWPQPTSGKHACEQVHWEAIGLWKTKNREFPDPKTRAGVFDRSQWLASLLHQLSRTRFTKALITERCSIPVLADRVLRVEPDVRIPRQGVKVTF